MKKSIIDNTIIQAIKTHGPLNYTGLGVKTGYCACTVRQHVIRLMAEGVVKIRRGGWQNPSCLVSLAKKKVVRVFQCDHRSNGGNCYFPGEPHQGRVPKSGRCPYHPNMDKEKCLTLAVAKR